MPAILIPSSHKHVELWASNVELSRRMLNCSLGDLCSPRILDRPLHGELSSCMVHYKLECTSCDQ